MARTSPPKLPEPPKLPDLPDSVHLHIASFLSREDRARLSETCRALNACCEREWHHWHFGDADVVLRVTNPRDAITLVRVMRDRTVPGDGVPARSLTLDFSDLTAWGTVDGRDELDMEVLCEMVLVMPNLERLDLLGTWYRLAALPDILATSPRLTRLAVSTSTHGYTPRLFRCDDRCNDIMLG